MGNITIPFQNINFDFKHMKRYFVVSCILQTFVIFLRLIVYDNNILYNFMANETDPCTFYKYSKILIDIVHVLYMIWQVVAKCIYKAVCLMGCFV